MGMQNFDDTIHTFKWSSMSSFPVCMAAALYYKKIKAGYIIGAGFLRKERPGETFSNMHKYL